MDFGNRALIASIVLCAAPLGVACNESVPPIPADALMVEACELDDTTIGRCALVDTGAPCTGSLDEEREFVPLASDGQVPIVVGPQGSSMFVLAVRTSGIFPGSPDDPASPDNPEVTMSLSLEAGGRVALYRGRPYFSPDALEPTMLTAPGLFVIMENAHELVGEQLTAQAEILDRDGEARCGRAQFMVQTSN